MLIDPVTAGEQDRLEILADMAILDSPPEEYLDDVTELAAHICGTPIALISLIDSHRQWFKAKVGIDVYETPREFAFCVHAINGSDDILVIEDAWHDPRFEHNVLVTGPPYIRFYAGAPLVTCEGVAVGTLCVIDRVPRVLTAEQRSALDALRRCVITELERRRRSRNVDREFSGTVSKGLSPNKPNRAASPSDTNHQLVSVMAERARLEADLLRKEERLRSAIRLAALAHWEWDPANDEAVFSAEYKCLLGLEDENLPGCFRAWEERIHPEDVHRIRAVLSRFRSPGGSEIQTELRLLHRDGDYRWIAARAVSLANPKGERSWVLITHLDVTDSKTTERRIREAALHDPLTGLPNRALVFEYAARTLAAARRSGVPGAIMFIDLDRFKAINDTYGHKAGDAVLQEVARRLTRQTRSADVVGRIGGDEFLVILPDVSIPNVAAGIAQHLLNVINGPIPFLGLQLTVSPSIGICVIPREEASIDDLVRYADIAMYRAKKTGQNRFEFFTKALEEDYVESLSIEKRLRLALVAESFELYYQPIVNVASGAIVSVEGLLRWPTSPAPPIGPSQFIPIAEAAGIIHPLSRWAMEEACRQHHKWVEQGLPRIPIALNISPLQFQASEFGDEFSDLLSRVDTDACILQVEITENMLMQNIEQASRVLAKLKELGCTIALDDFGTGYSSLAYLSQLPLDKLKVDQSFVRRLEADHVCTAITQAIVALGQALKLQVVAEGIESHSTMQSVRRLGCEQGQGYFYSPPLPGDAFAKWYAQYEHRQLGPERHSPLH